MSKKKKSSGSKSSFSAKEFFIMHVEKLVFAFIAMIAGLAADGKTKTCATPHRKRC